MQVQLRVLAEDDVAAGREADGRAVAQPVRQEPAPLCKWAGEIVQYPLTPRVSTWQARGIDAHHLQVLGRGLEEVVDREVDL
jgi:hypothetical protein